MTIDPHAPPFTLETDHLDGYRVFTGPDGDSEIERLRLDARYWPMWDTGKRLGIIDLPSAPAPYREMFVMISGSITLKTAKASLELGPGSVLLFEDVDARTGHGGRTGPQGYISVSIAP